MAIRTQWHRTLYVMASEGIALAMIQNYVLFKQEKTESDNTSRWFTIYDTLSAKMQHGARHFRRL